MTVVDIVFFSLLEVHVNFLVVRLHRLGNGPLHQRPDAVAVPPVVPVLEVLQIVLEVCQVDQYASYQTGQ